MTTTSKPPDDVSASLSERSSAPASPDLIVAREPTLILDDARRAARALKDVLDAKPHPVVFNSERYLEFEDWQTVARFFGITCKVVDTQFAEYLDAKGFTARAVALRSDGV